MNLFLLQQITISEWLLLRLNKKCVVFQSCRCSRNLLFNKAMTFVLLKKCFNNIFKGFNSLKAVFSKILFERISSKKLTLEIRSEYEIWSKSFHLFDLHNTTQTTDIRYRSKNYFFGHRSPQNTDLSTEIKLQFLILHYVYN